MSGVILQHTVCEPGWIQGGWAFNRPACGKPRSDLKLETMCYTSPRHLNATKENQDPSTAGSLGIDFGDRGDEAFKACCDPPGYRDTTVLYQKEKDCGGMNFCFTDNPVAAQNWTWCVQDAASRLMDELRAEGEQFNFTVEEAMEAECEVVYYDWLRDPMLVRQPNPEKCLSGAVQRGGMSARVVLFTVLVASVLLL
ncbi:hypothetical protein PG993_012575 [Apiospora rasikravindrae]|uniref:Uncharacterized protein n=1 Tax=Apiospora rasikravindrae TaxID=990691 RepID=A0ABR1S2U7_9PEZI